MEKKSGHEQQMDMNKGQPILGENTIWWTLAGLLIGGAIGLLIGVAFGYGRLNIAGLAPLATGGVGVAGFVFASFFGSLLGLAGALLGTASDARKAQNGHTADHKGMTHGKPSLVERLPIYGSFALVFSMVLTLYVIASRAIGSGAPSDQSNRVTWNQKNAARVGGATDSETATHVLQTAFPATRAENRPGTIVTVGDDWRIALAATVLISRPTNAALIVSGPAGVDAEASREIERMRGSVATPSPSPVQSTSPSTTQQAMPSPSPQPSSTPPLSLSIGGGSPSVPNGEAISSADPALVAAAIDERHARDQSNSTWNVIIVAADADYRWAVPAGAYAARTGTSILYVTKDGVPAATAAALQRRGKQVRVFVLGPAAAVPARMFDQLKQFGAVTRIEGSDYYANAVRFAEFRDEAADFGWGHSGRGSRQWATTNTILVNSERWQDGVLAAHLARTGKAGPLLFTQRNRLPAVVDNHLWRQRPVFAGTPAEGPFNHIWVVGSFDRIAYGTQAWADYSQEIEQYMTLSDSAVSGYEALGIGWLALSIACAGWILFHSIKRLPDVMPMMKAAWAIFSLMLGPLAVWLYIASYHRREKSKHEGMVMWERPLWLQTVSATVMMFAFDMMLMCLAVFFVAYFGFPIIRFNGSLYWLGSSMFLMMVLMFVIALIVMMLVFHTPMTMHEQKIKSYGKAFIVGLPIMVATMSVESLGMMPTMWWQQMIFLPAMQMPTNDDFTMWTTLLFSVCIGFLVVLPFNYWMVKRGKKMGMM